MKRNERIRILYGVAAAILLGLSFGAAAPAAAEEVLRWVSWGGATQKGHRDSWFEDFQKKTGIKIVEDTWNGDFGKIRAMVQAKNVQWDVLDSDPHVAVNGCQEGVLEKIDPKFLGDLSDFESGAITDCGIGSHTYTNLWAWNGDKQKFPSAQGPQKLADIYNTQKWPGKRGFFKRVYILAEWALIADGVPVKDVYKELGTPTGLDRVFKKLDSIKKDIMWLPTVSHAMQMLADGEVDYTQTALSRYYAAIAYDKKNFHPMWDAQSVSYVTWIVPKGTPNMPQVKKFLEYIMEPTNAVKFTEVIPYTPTRRSAAKLVSDKMKPHLATAHFENAFFVDRLWWPDHIDAYNKRFEAWLQK